MEEEELTETDWTYNMRRDMQEIVSGLYLGPYSVASKSKLSMLQAHGITHIVCIRQQKESHYIKINFPDYFKYLDLNISDSPLETIIPYLNPVKQFLNECFNSGGKALVHGNAGICRSAAIVIGYIMEKYQLSYRKASAHVLKRRFCVCPGENFARQLHEFEPIYVARQLCENMNSVDSVESAKRKHDDLEIQYDSQDIADMN